MFLMSWMWIVLTLLQGTVHFMSANLREALNSGRKYLQSPIDDLESFYHVFVWAILHNVGGQSFLTIAEKRRRDKLSGTSGDRELAQKQLRKQRNTTLMRSDVQRLMNAWYSTQDALEEKWSKIEDIFDWLTAGRYFARGTITVPQFREWSWHLIAFEGVLRILNDIYSVRDEMLTSD